MVRDLFAVDSFGMTRHFYELGGKEAAIRQLRCKFEI